jgi:DNA-binding MarR family transcriptional regulator
MPLRRTGRRVFRTFPHPHPMDHPSAPGATALDVDLYDQPGHLIRRAQQIAVSMFHDTLGREVTPVQYAVLRMLHECPGLDQVTLAQRVALDTSTTADIAVRLEAKGWILREVLPRRQRRLVLTPAGEALLAGLIPAVNALQHGLLDSMGPDDSRELLRLLRKFVHLNNGQSRAPLRTGGETA